MTDKMTSLSDIIITVDTFPSLPAVASKVLMLSSDPDSSIGDLIEVICCDPSLSAEILKLSNSAFFGRPETISNLKEAVSLIGFNEIRNIVVAKAIFNSFKKLKQNANIDLHLFWQHSFLTAVSTKIFSNLSGVSGDDLFIAGLIHDIGKLVIILSLKEPLESHRKLSVDEEADLFGISHDEVAARLLKAWKFPDNLVESIGNHHKHDRMDSNLNTRLLYLSDQLALLAFSFGQIFDSNPPDMIPVEKKTMNIAKKCGIVWNKESITKYISQLDILLNQSSELYNLLTS